MKKTLVIGASENTTRYSNMAIHRLRSVGIEVCAIGLKQGIVGDVKIETGLPFFSDIHTVTMYVGEKNQSNFYDYIESLQPKRVIFNPGAENEQFAARLRKKNIEVLEACTLVMLSTGQY